MACDLTAGRLHPCKTVGGIKNIYFVNFANSIYTGITTDADDQITGFGTALTLYKYELRGAQSFDETDETSADAGTTFWSTNGTITLKDQDIKTRKEMKLMAATRPVVITEGYDGKYKMYGIQNGCDVAVSTASGANMGDFNGYNLVITASEKEPAYFVDSTIIGDTINSTVTEGV